MKKISILLLVCVFAISAHNSFDQATLNIKMIDVMLDPTLTPTEKFLYKIRTELCKNKKTHVIYRKLERCFVCQQKLADVQKNNEQFMSPETECYCSDVLKHLDIQKAPGERMAHLAAAQYIKILADRANKTPEEAEQYVTEACYILNDIAFNNNNK